MKLLDIAFKDMTRSFRSFFALVFMFGVPLLVTGMFYLMFGGMADNEEFSVPVTRVVIANLDKGDPNLKLDPGSLPGGLQADTLGTLVTGVLQDDVFSDLFSISLAAGAEEARAAVDGQSADVAVILPEDFSKQFAALDGHAELTLYQDPDATLGPAIVRSVIGRFMDELSGVKIAMNVALAENGSPTGQPDPAVINAVIQAWFAQPAADALVNARSPHKAAASNNLMRYIIGPIMGGMMIFYAFYTGVSTAESILREDEDRTLPRLFTTPTSRSAILSGKFLAVFLTVLVQVITLLIAARLIFGIDWGEPLTVALVAAGVILTASTFGIFVNSLLKDTRQGGMIFGGVLTVTGMLGMIRIFAMNAPGAARLGDTVGLLVPQGWAVRGLLGALSHQPPSEVLPELLMMLAWSSVFFALGVWRFRARYG
jgi:ABC-2 type transport system permease protein